jgi:hypothetical protein
VIYKKVVRPLTLPNLIAEPVKFLAGETLGQKGSELRRKICRTHRKVLKEKRGCSDRSSRAVEVVSETG